MREATLSWSELHYAERSIAGRNLQVLVGANSGNIELGGSSQTTDRRKASCVGSREEMRQLAFNLFLGPHSMVKRTAAVASIGHPVLCVEFKASSIVMRTLAL